MKKLVAAALMFAALGAGAQVLPQAAPQAALSSADPLARQILAKCSRPEGCVTGAVAVKGLKGSVALDLSDAAAAPAALAPAAASPDIALKPAAGLKRAAPPRKTARKPLRRASEQLKHLGSRDGKSWGERR